MIFVIVDTIGSIIDESRYFAKTVRIVNLLLYLILTGIH